MEFDDFKNTPGDLPQKLEKAFESVIKNFLKNFGTQKVDELAVRFKTQPFLDILVGFSKNGQVFLLDKTEVKNKHILENLDSALAHTFADLKNPELEELCKTLETNLSKKFVYKNKKVCLQKQKK